MRAANFLTVIYQIDSHCRRLLWVGRKRTQATLRRGLTSLGSESRQRTAFCLQRYVAALPQCDCGQSRPRFACAGSVPYHDAFEPGGGPGAAGREWATARPPLAAASGSNICAGQLLRRGSRVRGQARRKLDALVASKLATARAWTLKESFQYLWHYKSSIWAGAFLDYWCSRAMRSRLEPMKKVARMLRTHEELLLNWFKAKGEISSGAVEGLNNKIRVVTRRAYGFRTFDAMEIALYHTLGRLPEPESTHRFC